MNFLIPNESTQRLPVGARLQLCAEVLTNLAGCPSGVLALIDACGSVQEYVRIGPAPERESGATVNEELRLLVRQMPEAADQFMGLAPCHPLIARLFGEPPVGRAHSVIGRISWQPDCDLVLVAGWRPTCLEPLEAALLGRGVNACRNAIQADSGKEGGEGAGLDLINSVVSPVIRVDERLNIVNLNEAAQRELMQGGVLREQGGRLASAACHAMEELRAAVRRSVREAGGEGRRSSIIPLTGDAGLPRFAIVAPSPLHGEDPTAVVVLPEIDGEEGARRLSALYSLTRAEEGVVRLILVGAAPVGIAAELGLTEATVRTYIKRIMVKLGINRRSEFFLLYILTMSPFRFPTGPLSCRSA